MALLCGCASTMPEPARNGLTSENDRVATEIRFRLARRDFLLHVPPGAQRRSSAASSFQSSIVTAERVPDVTRPRRAGTARSADDATPNQQRSSRVSAFTHPIGAFW